MVESEIPRWITKLDERKPYIEVLDGKKLPDVITDHTHGQLVARIGIELNEWAGDRGGVGVYVRFYFLRTDGKWTSLLPDVEYTSYARLRIRMGGPWQRSRIAPDIAVEILAPGDCPDVMHRKIETYLEFGAMVVIVLHPRKRIVYVHRADGSVEERDARGAWALVPFDDLILDWEKVYRQVCVGD